MVFWRFQGGGGGREMWHWTQMGQENSYKERSYQFYILKAGKFISSLNWAI